MRYDCLLTQICIGLPAVINRTYIDQTSYWLTFFPYVDDFTVTLVYV
jgi:hypothetical protein